MSLSFKEWLIVSILAGGIFALARPICLKFSTDEDYLRRCGVWCLLTTAAFFTPNFWWFALFAVPVLIWAQARESNPAALFLLLLYVVPPLSLRVPMVGISFLFNINFGLLLSFCVMVPAAFRLRDRRLPVGFKGLGAMDYLLFGYVILTVFLFVRPEISRGVLMVETPTDSIRRAFEAFFGLIVPYLVVSRSVYSRKALLEVMMCFCLACCVYAAIAVFEAARHWLLYNEMMIRWGGGAGFTFYVARLGSLRAMASTGHPLALGYLLSIALGFWLSLQHYVKSTFSRLAISALLAAGLLAAYSRGAWIASVLVYFSFTMLRPQRASALLRAIGVTVLVASLVAISPLRHSIVNVLPFMGGTADYRNVLYRERLFDREWQIVLQGPLFGDPYALLKMQDLRQGQGIIDLVLPYMTILLGTGFVGLVLYMSFFLIGLLRARATGKALARVSPGFSMVGASLVACMLGTLLIMASGGSNDIVVCMLAALAGAYARLGRAEPVRQAGNVRGTATVRNRATGAYRLIIDEPPR
jgi:hypothetical protein